ncbi:MAG: PspC domain-containing protein [Bifidobacterium crudilactis]|jgi:signal transduction histidine kinase/phage shock protein PspC (stress-responsive transcriptional regulator)|uniref:ATP-binding protein n=1 Tax=Bifidobacterium crudilactis TaxID=327277 RepID=UPI003A5C3185
MPFSSDSGTRYRRSVPSGESTSGTQPALLPARYPLLRPKQGRIISGVCRGVALHLGMHTWLVRLIALVMVPFFGAGIVAYMLLIICIPSGDPTRPQSPQSPPQDAPIAKGNTQDEQLGQKPEGLLQILRRTPLPLAGLVAGVILLAFGLLFAARGLPVNIIIPLLMTACGVGISWLRVDSDGTNITTLVVSIALMLASLVIYAFTTYAFSQASQVLFIAALLLAGVTLALIPWANSLVQKLSAERAMKEREEERADMTAHLHDGVLQTLALIQLHAAEPKTVSTLARSQERSLRDWLYQERTPAERSVSSGIRDIAASMELAHHTAIEVVTVGDALPSERTEALLDATRQALTNAATHGGEPISVYCEAHDDVVDVFVRDHGKGFDVDGIPQDRLGIRESIIGRMRRKGGTVEIVSRPSWGTEVRMHMAIDATPRQAGQEQGPQAGHDHPSDQAPDNTPDQTPEQTPDNAGGTSIERH